MDSRKVTDIPLNQWNIMPLTILTTGVMPTVQGSNLSTPSGSFQTMGASERNNNFLLDGVDNNDPTVNSRSCLRSIPFRNSNWKPRRTAPISPSIVNEARIGFNRLIGGIFEELYK